MKTFPLISVRLHEDQIALIGMDIINQGSFLLNYDPRNKKSIFQFSKPALESCLNIDFKKESERENDKNKTNKETKIIF